MCENKRYLILSNFFKSRLRYCCSSSNTCFKAAGIVGFSFVKFSTKEQTKMTKIWTTFFLKHNQKLKFEKVNEAYFQNEEKV
ncbi:hypothetical protein BpHYR1_028609 [Brachionus plicatilis]|uniref:Uncharacterized protein n=1 Tax=Brachionus plicatilis TaxID=10195 RepID=A0A3M7Q8M2_BRAPC|nr:hypothetical protein BpHYR1_028609 [Brachionus plicatilis]